MSPHPMAARALRVAALILASSLALAACARAARVTAPAPRDQLYTTLVGRWQGTLTTPLDAEGSVLQTQPARLQVLPAPDSDGLELRYATLDHAPLPTVDHLHLDRAMRLARVGTTSAPHGPAFAVREVAGGTDGAPLRLVLEVDGTEDDQPVRIRETLEVGAGTMALRTEAREPGGPWRLRRAHAFRRAE